MATKGDIRQTVPNEVFRDVIGRFASGVTVITTTAHDGDHGTTASAVSSLSMDPPMLLICLNKSSDTQVAIHQSGVFGVNILAEHQGQLAYAFARKGPDKFDGVAVARGRTGVPLVVDALAHLECEVDETVTGGTHTVFLARVKEAAGSDGAPLTYFRGQFGRLENALDESAYRELRRRIIERALPAGERLDIERLATELDLATQHVYYALTRLSIDDLVERRPDGHAVKPLTAQVAADLFDARRTIQLGVVEQTVGSIGGEQLDELQQLAEDFARAARTDPPDLPAFLRASHTFHQQLISLAACPPLSEAYERLGIPAFWTRTLAKRRWWEEWNVTHHGALVEAYRAGDVERAKRLVHEHCEWVTGLARLLIDEAGGAV